MYQCSFFIFEKYKLKAGSNSNSILNKHDLYDSSYSPRKIKNISNTTKCTTCKSTIWLNESQTSKLHSGALKEAFCKDCHIKKKIKANTNSNPTLSTSNQNHIQANRVAVKEVLTERMKKNLGVEDEAELYQIQSSEKVKLRIQKAVEQQLKNKFKTLNFGLPENKAKSANRSADKNDFNEIESKPSIKENKDYEIDYAKKERLSMLNKLTEESVRDREKINHPISLNLMESISNNDYFKEFELEHAKSSVDRSNHNLHRESSNISEDRLEAQKEINQLIKTESNSEFKPVKLKLNIKRDSQVSLVNKNSSIKIKETDDNNYVKNLEKPSLKYDNSPEFNKIIAPMESPKLTVIRPKNELIEEENSQSIIIIDKYKNPIENKSINNISAQKIKENNIGTNSKIEINSKNNILQENQNYNNSSPKNKSILKTKDSKYKQNNSGESDSEEKPKVKLPNINNSKSLKNISKKINENVSTENYIKNKIRSNKEYSDSSNENSLEVKISKPKVKLNTENNDLSINNIVKRRLNRYRVPENNKEDSKSPERSNRSNRNPNLMVNNNGTSNNSKYNNESDTENDKSKLLRSKNQNQNQNTKSNPLLSLKARNEEINNKNGPDNVKRKIKTKTTDIYKKSSKNTDIKSNGTSFSPDQKHKVSITTHASLEIDQVNDYNRIYELNKKLFSQIKKGEENSTLEEELKMMNKTFESNLHQQNKNPNSNLYNSKITDDTHLLNSTQPVPQGKSPVTHSLGHCKIVYMDKSEYEGQISNGKYHGHGVFKYKSGHVYIGEWANGFQHGNGKLIYKDGSKYSGQFRNGMREGKGYMVWHAGQHSYDGSWAQDCKHGYGKEKFSSGDYYEGNFTRGKKEGHGEYIWHSGTIYRGEYKQNRMEGYGVLEWPTSGRKYEGQMKDNYRHGMGSFSWADGTVYQGGFYKDKRFGFGIIYYTDGGIFEGEWLQDCKHGKAVYKHPQPHCLEEEKKVKVAMPKSEERWYFLSNETTKDDFERRNETLSKEQEMGEYVQKMHDTSTNIQKYLKKGTNQNESYRSIY